MPPATAPTPAPTAAPTGPPTTAPVTAPVVAPAATPFCAFAARGNESAAAIVRPARILVFMKSSVCETADRERQRQRAVPALISFLPGTFLLFQHLVANEVGENATQNRLKGENHANSALGTGNTDPVDHPVHAAAPLTRFDGQQPITLHHPRRLK